VAWTRTGEGTVGIEQWVRKFTQLCPGRALSAEVIVTPPRMYDYLKPEFWPPYRNTPAWEFARFLKLAENGAPRPPLPRVPPEQVAQRQREDLEVSFAWMKKLLRG